ncbi:hypothetical protein AA313_de0201419 [Arthrobotrys entomopaga]|nr:hypothetical protein AA313_de0201419 [Arthrobotrys entomopaga]
MFSLLLDSTSAETICEIYFHTFYPEPPKEQPIDAPKPALEVLKKHVRNLYLSTVDIWKWVNHPLGKIVRFTNLHTLNSLHHTFRKYDEYLTNIDRRNKLKTAWLEQRKNRQNEVINPSDLWYQNEVDATKDLEIEAMTAMVAAHSLYWRVGSLFIVRDYTLLALNPLFVFRKGVEGWGMDPNCNPLVGFMDIKSIVAQDILWQPIFHLKKDTPYSLYFLTKHMYDTLESWGQAFRRAVALDNLRVMITFAQPLNFCLSIQPISKEDVGRSLLLREVYGNHERDIEYLPPMKQTFNMIDARDVAQFFGFYNVFIVTEGLLEHNEQSLLAMDVVLQGGTWVNKSSLDIIMGVRAEFFCDAWRFDMIDELRKDDLPWAKQYFGNDYQGVKTLLWRRLPGDLTEYDIFEKERDYVTEEEADNASFNMICMMYDSLASTRAHLSNAFASNFGSFTFLVRGLFARKANRARWKKALARIVNKFKNSNEFVVSLYLQGFLRFKMPCDCEVDGTSKNYPMLLCVSIGLPISVIHEAAYRIDEFWGEGVQVIFLLIIRKKLIRADKDGRARGKAGDGESGENGLDRAEDVNEGSESPSVYEDALEERPGDEKKMGDENGTGDGEHEEKDETQALEDEIEEQESETENQDDEQPKSDEKEQNHEAEEESSEENDKADDEDEPSGDTEEISADEDSIDQGQDNTANGEQTDTGEKGDSSSENEIKSKDTSGTPSKGESDDKEHEHGNKEEPIDKNEEQDALEDIDLDGSHCIHRCKLRERKLKDNGIFVTQFQCLRVNFGKIALDNPPAEDHPADRKYIHEGAPTLLYNKNEWTAGKGGVITFSFLMFPEIFEERIEEYDYQLGMMENRKGVGDCVTVGSLNGNEVVFSTNFPRAIEEKVESKKSKKKKKKKQSMESLVGKENQQIGIPGGDDKGNDGTKVEEGVEDTSFTSLGTQEEEKVPVFISGKEDKWSVFLKTKQGLDME